jgi:hypothetical protein
LELDGTEKSIAAYPDLAAYLGTTYNKGDETPGNFRLPDYRGEFRVAGPIRATWMRAVRLAPASSVLQLPLTMRQALAWPDGTSTPQLTTASQSCLG